MTSERWTLAPEKIEQWVVSPDPLIEIGVVEGDLSQELFDATSSIRLSDGRVVVANTGARELRFFDRSGQIERVVGGSGGGPGEFRFLRRITGLPGDSILALDWSRANVFDSAGTFVRTEPFDQLSEVARRDLWIRGKFWVAAPAHPYPPAVIKQVLDRLPPPTGNPPYRVVVPSPSGGAWIREPAVPGDANRMWIALDPDGRVARALQLPRRFEAHDIGSDWVLGRWRNDDDVNFIRLFGITRGAGTSTAPVWMRSAPEPTAPLTDEQRRALSGVMSGLVTAQENYFAQHGRYGGAEDALDFELPEGVNANIVMAQRQGWLAAVWPANGAIVCGVAVGAQTPLGWTEGEMTCNKDRPGP